MVDPQPASPSDQSSIGPWSGRDLAAGLTLLLIGYAAVVVVVTIVALNVGDPAEDPNAALAAAIATFGFSLWLATAVLILATRKNLTLEQIGFRPLRGTALLWPVATWMGALAILVVYGLIVVVFGEVTGRDVSRMTEGNPLPDTEAMTTTVWAVLGLSVILAAPIGEELFFRSLLFRAVQARWGLIAGMAISGLLFALVHLAISVVIPFMGIGMLFAWAYRKSGSLWTPVIAHAIFNGVSFAATVSGVAS